MGSVECVGCAVTSLQDVFVHLFIHPIPRIFITCLLCFSHCAGLCLHETYRLVVKIDVNQATMHTLQDYSDDKSYEGDRHESLVLGWGWEAGKPFLRTWCSSWEPRDQPHHNGREEHTSKVTLFQQTWCGKEMSMRNPKGAMWPEWSSDGGYVGSRPLFHSSNVFSYIGGGRGWGGWGLHEL